MKGSEVSCGNTMGADVPESQGRIHSTMQGSKTGVIGDSHVEGLSLGDEREVLGSRECPCRSHWPHELASETTAGVAGAALRQSQLTPEALHGPPKVICQCTENRALGGKECTRIRTPLAPATLRSNHGLMADCMKNSS